MEIIPKSLGSLYMVFRGTTQTAREGTVYPSDKEGYKHKVVWDTGEISYFNGNLNRLNLAEAKDPENNSLDFKPNGTYITTQETEYCGYKSALDNFIDETIKKLENLGWGYNNYVPWLKKGEYVTVIAACDANQDTKHKMYAVATLNAEPREWAIVLEKEIEEIKAGTKI